MSAPPNMAEYKPCIVRINGRWCMFANRWKAQVTRRAKRVRHRLVYLPQYTTKPHQHAMHARADTIAELTARFKR